MTHKLKPHPCATAIRKVADILERGEQEMWSLDGTPLNVVVLRTNTVPILPNDSHPHYARWSEWQKLIQSGAVERGEAWIEFHGSKTSLCEWRADQEYKIVRKEKKRLIDWSKMPRGAITQEGELICFSTNNHCTILGADRENGGPLIKYVECGKLRLAPAEEQPSIFLHRGECPVPDGVIVEVEYRSGGSCVDQANCFGWDKRGISGDIIAYRIAGLSQGWTDNPEAA